MEKYYAFSPRTRGCSAALSDAIQILAVFPAHAGMFREICGYRDADGSFPRARGDVPLVAGDLSELTKFSPRTRGCSAKDILTESCFKVFPAHAGMFLRLPLPQLPADSFPRARGDVPASRVCQISMGSFSPRTRGCSAFPGDSGQADMVFPAHAGMFLTPAQTSF